MTSTIGLTRQLVTTIVTVSPRRAAAAATFTFAVGLLEGVGLLALVPMLQLVGLDADRGSLGSIMTAFHDAFSVVGLEPTLPLVLGLYVGIVGIQALLLRQQAVLQTALREDITHVVRARLYRAIQGTTWLYFSRMRTAAFNELLTQRVDRVATAVYYLLDLFVTGVIACVYVAMALRVSTVMSLAVMASGALLGLTLRSQLAAARRAGELCGAASSRLYRATADHLDSTKLAKSYDAVERHTGRFEELSRELGAASRSATAATIAMRQWVTLGSAALLAVIVYTAHAIVQMPAAAMFLLMFLFARLLPRVTSLYEKAQLLAGYLPAFEQVLDAERRCVAEAETAVESPQAVTFARTIECEDVAFSYRSDDQFALLNVDISIPARATTAIVGPSGAGKSTVADLLIGLITPQEGRVTVDGIQLVPERLASWRSQIGYVSQDSFLFHDTVRANLLWANQEATEDALWTALSQAAADDFVRRLPAGLDTLVGDRGIALSGGERQRLSLARALLRHPALLILDEATSALDSDNEGRIQQAVEQLHAQITIVQITHRLSTIRHADVIYVIDDGQVVEFGSWDELVTRPEGRLRALARAQGIECGPGGGPAPPRHFGSPRVKRSKRPAGTFALKERIPVA